MKKFIKYISLILFIILLTSCGGGKTTTNTTTTNNIHTNDKPEKCDHKFVEVMRQDSTCCEPGFIDYECMFCFEHKHEELPLIDHQWTEWELIYDATIDQEGLESRRCKHCGEEEQQSIPRLEHEHNYEKVDEEEPTCEHGGYEIYECECGDEYSVELDPISHKYSEWSIIMKPTCSSNGFKERVCEECDHKETQTIYSDGHHYIDNKCEYCGQEDIEYLTFTLNSDKKSYTLTSCSSTVTTAVVPNTFNGLPVTNIKKGAFEECTKLTSITLPFVGVSANIEDGTEKALFGYIFGTRNGNTTQYLDGMSYRFGIPQTLRKITITGGYIPKSAFDGISFVTDIIIESPVTDIKENAFNNCKNLTNIIFPETLENIEGELRYLNNIKKIDLSHCTNLKTFGYIMEFEKLEEVIFPKNVESILGFRSCFNLSKIVMPETLNEMGEGFLYDCPSVTEFTIPNGIKKLGMNAFINSSLKEIVIPDSVEEIDWYAFYCCHNLEKVTMSNSLLTLGGYAFSSCEKLKEISLPSTLTSVGDEIFAYCSSLEKITIPFLGKLLDDDTSNIHLGMLFGQTEYDNSYKARPSSYGSYYYLPNSLKEVNVLGGKLYSYVFAGCKSIEALSLGESVESLESNFISNCTNLTQLDLSNCKNLKEIGKNAFANSYITSLTIPSSVEVIKETAFKGSKALKEVLFEENSNLKTIEKYAFQQCTLLEKLILPASVEIIEQYALSGCNAINYLGLPAVEFNFTSDDFLAGLFGSYNGSETLKTLEITGGTEISDLMFNNCYNIETVKIPSSITKIGNYSFDRCSNLKEVIFEDVDSITSIGEYAFSQCGITSFTISKNLNKLENAIFYSSDLESIIIPNNIEIIENNAFSHCSNLKEIEFEENSKLTKIGQNAFNQSIVSEIVIPNSVEYIDDSAFNYCRSLEHIQLSNSLKHLGNDVFVDCSNLKELTLPDSLEFIGETILERSSDTIGLEKLTIPYLGQTNEENGMGLAYTFGDKYYDGSLEVIITKAKYLASGSMTKYVIALTLPETLEKIESGIFNNSLSIVERLTIPFMGTKEETGEIIDINTYGRNVLQYTLKEITILNSNIIPENSFSYFNKLEKVTFKGDVEKISYNVFGSCSSLKEVEFKGEVKEIGYYSFSGCHSLEKINFPEGLKFIDGYAFHNCSSLNNLYLPESLEKISEYAFSYCESLTEVEIKDGLKEIENQVFSNCINLKSIKLPETLEKISENVFSYCDSLTELNIPYSAIISENALSYINSLEKLSLHIEEPLSYYFEEIPSSLRVVTVDCEELFENALTNIDSIEEIYMSNNMLKVNFNSFTNTDNLKKIVFSDSIVDVADGLLKGLSNKLIWENPSVIKSYMYTGYIGEEIVIKESVKNIEAHAFYNTDAKIIWENTNITNIRSYTFEGYKGENIPLANTITSIESKAFYNTSANIDMENASIKTITSNMFEGYKGENIILPNTIKTLESRAFAYYDGNIDFNNLKINSFPSHIFDGRTTDFIIPDFINTIDGYTFSGFLGNITIGSNVETIEARAFNNYQGNIIWDNPTIEIIKEETFYGYLGEELVIPNSVLEIEYQALGLNSKLRKLTIPFVGRSKTADEKLGETTFGYIFGNTGFDIISQYYTDVDGEVLTKEYSIPMSLLSVVVLDNNIPYGAFSGCIFIKNVVAENAILVGERAFEDCKSLSKVVLGESLRQIHPYAFRNCSNLKDINLAEGLFKISEEVFNNCSNLRKVILPSTLTYIQPDAFKNCYNLVEVYNLSNLSIEAGSNMPGGGVALHAKIVYKSLDEESRFSIIDDKYMVYFDKENDCYSIESYLGNDKDLVLPDLINDKPYSIREYAFKNITSLETLYIPSTVTSIGYAVFNGCSNLKEITVPYVGSQLTDVSSEQTVLGYIFGSEEFNNSYKVPQLRNYDEDELNYYLPKDLTKVEVLGGNILDFAFYYCMNIKEIILPENITSIGNYAFTYTKPKDGKIIIPEGVVSIGDYAYSEVEGINIYLPSTIEYIGRDAFYKVGTDVYYYGTTNSWLNIKFVSADSNPIDNGCMYLFEENRNDWFRVSEFVIPNTVTHIGDYQFKGLNAYCNIIIPSSVTSFGNTPFLNAGGSTYYNMEKLYGTLDLSNITMENLPNGIINGSNYSYIILPNMLKTVENGALSNNKSLEEISFADGLLTIGNNAFENCTSLKKVYIPDTVTQMGYEVFANCSSLEDLTIPFVGKELYFRTKEENGITYNQHYSTEYFLGYIFNHTAKDGFYLAEQRFLKNSNEEVVQNAYFPKSLKKVTILNGIVIDGAFYGCSYIEEIDYQGEYGFDVRSFRNCTSLKTLTLSNTIKYIDSNALFNCDNLKIVNFRGTKEEYDSIGFWASTFENATINYNYKE